MRNPIPTAFSEQTLLDQTVTIRVADLYDFLTRRKDDPMPDLNNATTVRKTKRGYRKVSMNLPVRDYEYLARLAEEQTRTPDQQALYLLRQKLEEMNDDRLNQPTPSQGQGLVDELDGLLPGDLPEEDDAVPEPIER